MVTLKGAHLYLRALEQADLPFLYHLENNQEVWEVSGTLTPFSKDVLQNYLENAHRDIYEVKQLRLVICNHEDDKLGLIDLFDFEPHHQRVGIGVVVANASERNKGVGTEAIELLCNYVFNVLGCRQVYANMLEENTASIHVFEKLGFKKVGIKKQWIRSGTKFKNEILYQKINNKII